MNNSILDFKFLSDEAHKRTSSRCDCSKLDQLELLYYVFDSEITFIIRGIDFKFTSGKIIMPVLDLIWSLSLLVHDFDKNDAQNFSFEITETDDKYYLKKTNDLVDITCDWSDSNAQIEYVELRTMIVNFILKVMKQCEFQQINLIQNPAYLEMKHTIIMPRLGF